MKVSWPVELAGTGVCVPDRVVSNLDFAARLDTSDEWILQRTGIRERRFASQGTHTVSLATGASEMAIRSAGITPKDIDLILLATITPSRMLPASACDLQAALGCRTVPAFDLNAACSGFVYGMITAAQYIQCGTATNVLIVGSEIMSCITDQEDRSTAPLFGDGAGALVMRAATRPRSEVLFALMGADGGGANLITIPAGGSAEPASTRTVNERLHTIRMKGREVYKFAVMKMQELVEQTLSETGVRPEELKLVVPHQSNLRIIESAVEKLEIPIERVVVNIDRYGNTSAASVPLALHEGLQTGRCGPGDLILVIAFGAGLTWSAMLIRL